MLLIDDVLSFIHTSLWCGNIGSCRTIV